MLTSLLKDEIKDTHEQPDEEIHRSEVWEGPQHRNFCPPGVGVHHIPGMWVCSFTWKLFEPHTIRILWKLPHVDKINYQLHFQPFFPL